MTPTRSAAYSWMTQSSESSCQQTRDNFDFQPQFFWLFGWYLNELRQPKDNLSKELSKLIRSRNLTLKDLRREETESSMYSESFINLKVKKIINFYFAVEGGHRFCPFLSVKQSSGKLQWTVEENQQK